MALVTLELSNLEGAATPSQAKNEDEKSKRKRMQRRQSFVMVKGAALLLQEEGEPEEVTDFPATSGPSEQQLHLQAMLRLLREEDTLKLAVRLEPVRSCLIRYLLVVSSVGTSCDGETILLGVDFPHDGSEDCTIGTVLPVWTNTQVFLDGDGGFSVTSGMDVREFKPISVQTMWSLLQVLHKACEGAVSTNMTGSSLQSGVNYYMGLCRSPQGCLNAWISSSEVTSTRKDPSAPERKETEKIIKRKLRDILRECDLENITSKEVRNALEQHSQCNLQQYTEFIDNEMIIILAQMDKPSEIFPYLYLGSEWNASNLEELQRNKVSHILNVTREIDNFYPGIFTYLNIRVLDEESTNLLQHWKETHNFISSARQMGTCVLVHCKMGVSRSASTVIAYAMKQYEWTYDEALEYVKKKRNIVQPNPGFTRQLQIYQGILGASKQRHNCLWDASSTPPHHPQTSTTDTLPGIRSSSHTTRPMKMSLRTLMRSISEMEGRVTPRDDETMKVEERDIEKEKRTTEREACTSEKIESELKMEETIMEKNNRNMDNEHVKNIKQVHFDDQHDRTMGENEFSERTEEDAKNLCMPLEGDTSTLGSLNSSQDMDSINDESTSVDEVFVSGSPSQSPSPRASSSARRRSRRRRKNLAQPSVELSHGYLAVKTQSVADLEGAAIVSRRLQKERRKGIIRQNNITETLEDAS
ncbi:phosphatase Slingshot homolog 3 isoform X2 [Pelobates cultripes]|uniref:protein-serine/threonine phosphatase n=2 Tax=Pelobates cultripes TaxID=61616 RepID=A0AAD1WSF9_PELCU|nr:phosphatase Slingshot homolog 3 isoform X2 [Pelobates cultripes]